MGPTGGGHTGDPRQQEGGSCGGPRGVLAQPRLFQGDPPAPQPYSPASSATSTESRRWTPPGSPQVERWLSELPAALSFPRPGAGSGPQGVDARCQPRLPVALSEGTLRPGAGHPGGHSGRWVASSWGEVWGGHLMPTLHTRPVGARWHVGPNGAATSTWRSLPDTVNTFGTVSTPHMFAGWARDREGAGRPFAAGGN